MGAVQNLSFRASADFLSLHARARASQSSASEPMRRVLQFVVDQPGSIGELDAREVAERTGTSTATVVRTARRLGFGGYRELRFAMTAMTALSVPDVADDQVIGDIGAQDTAASMIGKLARDEQETIQAVANMLDPDDVTAVARLVAGAASVHVFGIVASGLVASDLVGKLNRIGVRSVAHVEGHEALTAAVLLDDAEVAIGISSSGATPDVVQAIAHAAARGVPTVAITTDPHSPLARTSDHVLMSVVGRESEMRPAALGSRLSQLFVIDALFVRVVQLTYDDATARMRATHEALLGRRRQTSPASRG